MESLFYDMTLDDEDDRVAAEAPIAKGLSLQFAHEQLQSHMHNSFAAPLVAVTLDAAPLEVIAYIDHSPAQLCEAIAGAIRESTLDPGLCDCSYELNHKGKLEVTLLVKHKTSIMGDNGQWYKLMKELVSHEFGLASGSLDFFVRCAGPGYTTLALDEFATNAEKCDS